MTRWSRKNAMALVPGDYLQTAVGYAPILSITPYRGMLDVHLDVPHPRSTRPKSEAATLCLYPEERVAFKSAADAPPLNARRKDALTTPPAFKRASTGQKPPGG